MFTGIIETLGTVKEIKKEGTNVHFCISASISNELKIDQSVAHNGVCLTVTECKSDEYWVTAIDETLGITNLGDWKVGTLVNLERCMIMNARLDGHIVQGHVDQTAICTKVTNENGSWRFYFEFEQKEHITVPKGSICVNGVSLTVVDSKPGFFSVAIIPYTYEHTNFQQIKEGAKVNLEFDIIGKYVSGLMKMQQA